MCEAPEAGILAERVGDVFSEFRASSLVEGFENAAPASLASAALLLLSRFYPCIFEPSVVLKMIHSELSEKIIGAAL